MYRYNGCLCKLYMESHADIWRHGLEYMHMLDLFFTSFNTVDAGFAALQHCCSAENLGCDLSKFDWRNIEIRIPTLREAEQKHNVIDGYCSLHVLCLLRPFLSGSILCFVG